jgi:polar amino acid transport system ATP-binding protein
LRFPSAEWCLVAGAAHADGPTPHAANQALLLQLLKIPRYRNAGNVQTVSELSHRGDSACLDDLERALTPLSGNHLVAMHHCAVPVTVTHEMGFAREVGDRIVFMDDGLVLEEGNPRELFASPSHQRTRSFLAKIL